MNVREKMRKVEIFRGCFNKIFNAVMTGERTTSIDWNEKIAPEFRKIEDLISELLSKVGGRQAIK